MSWRTPRKRELPLDLDMDWRMRFRVCCNGSQHQHPRHAPGTNHRRCPGEPFRHTMPDDTHPIAYCRWDTVSIEV